MEMFIGTKIMFALPKRVLQLTASNWPFANGSGRFIDLFCNGIALGSDITIAKTSDNFYMKVIPDDLIGRHLIVSGEFDRTPIQILIDFSKPGDRILDIGANIGYVSCCFLKKVECSTAVCVEPQPLVVDLLRENLKQFDVKRSEVVEAALSDVDGEIILNINLSNRGASSVHGIANGEQVNVAALSTENLLSRLERLDLIKIDVEGHEDHVLKSAERQLIRLQPRAILFEDHRRQAAPTGSLGSRFSNCGYDVFGIRKSLMKTSLVPIESVDGCVYTDYIAVSRKRQIPRSAREKYPSIVRA